MAGSQYSGMCKSARDTSRIGNKLMPGSMVPVLPTHARDSVAGNFHCRALFDASTLDGILGPCMQHTRCLLSIFRSLRLV